MTKDAYNNIYDRKGLGFYTEYISLPLQVNDLSKHLVPGKIISITFMKRKTTGFVIIIPNN